ncbi:phage virion morphogenesis protein [Dysgonomonas sp. Marseille-P4361]|uniref:phage virion morphogenesis protein n=1 Tax=Dysgonomonas sp. Marseille-P4361 TaxID=2161820 RepID=UPI000D555483|nr:phage virion morphogenesis protein [Dysgonomonas sp. Marseille-P4361]
MNIQEFARLFPQKMKELKDFVEGDDIKDILGVEATNHYKESFDNEGFTDEQLVKWDDVERRDEQSAWYGHSGQTGKFSQARTTAKILSGETGELANSLSYKHTDRGVRVTSPTAYGHVHQFGKLAKIYGKKSFQMPARPFMGKSVLLKTNIESKIKREIIKIMTK